MRKANITRKTKETNIIISLLLDGKGTSAVKTSLPFFDHMLTLFAKNCACNLKITAKGDIEIDEHHLMEDIGISIGKAIKKAMDKKGILRYGFASIPMDDSLAEVSLDISGRPFLVYNMGKDTSKTEKERHQLYEHFFYSLAIHAGITLHINLKYGKNFHHNIEAVFKAFGRALRTAIAKDSRIKGIPSTKGVL